MEKIFKRLDFVINETDSITRHFHQTERNEIMLFCMCLLDRLNFSSESLKILMDRFLSNTKVEYSCGIIIRSVLLDYLIILNAMEVYERNLNDSTKCFSELKEYCIMMLCDSVRNTLDYFDTFKTQISEQDLKNLYINLVTMNPECFEPYSYDGSKPIIRSKDWKSPKQLFNTLMTSRYLKKYKSIYEAYLFYSKYDHFGQMFYGLSRRNPLEQLASINKVTEVFPKVLLFTLVILESLYHSDNFITKKREDVVLFIDSIENIK